MNMARLPGFVKIFPMTSLDDPPEISCKDLARTGSIRQYLRESYRILHFLHFLKFPRILQVLSDRLTRAEQTYNDVLERNVFQNSRSPDMM